MTSPRASPNRAALERVARRLAPLLDRLVFVGGHVAELLITDPAAGRVRATDDVDVIVAVTTRTAYHRLGEELRACGFIEDTRPDAPLCRWRSHEGLALDVMPIEETILGFSNRWYPAAIDSAVQFALAPGLTIRIPPAPVFLATKWAAFDGRGGGDLLGSHDVEDIVAVVAGRREVTSEVDRTDRELRQWLAERTRRFLGEPSAADAIAGALPDARLDATLISRARDRLEQMSAPA